MSSSYYLGPLVGNAWLQYANSAGQVYYYDPVTRQSTFRLPNGWQDDVQDVWNYDNSPGWDQWVNNRTGRIILQDPNPPAAQTYLDSDHVCAHLQTIERAVRPSETLYRRAMTEILRWLFPNEEGYSVIAEDSRDTSIPDHVIFKISCRPGGSLYMYDFCMVECKRDGESWPATEEQCFNHCFNTENEVKKLYAIIQLGMQLQFYSFEEGNFRKLGGKLHLCHDVAGIIQSAEYMKENPHSFVR